MPSCAVCSDPKKRKVVEKARLEGRSQRTAAQLARVSPASVGRHERNHMAAALKQAIEAGRPVIERLQSLLEASEAKLRESMAPGMAPHQSAAMLRATREMLELVSKLTGELPTQQTIVVGLLQGVGLKDEQELKRVVAEWRQLDSVTPAEAAADAVLVLKQHLQEHPGDAGRLREELGL